MSELDKAAQAMDRLPIIDRESVPVNSPKATTLNTEGPGAHKWAGGGSLFILSHGSRVAVHPVAWLAGRRHDEQ